MVVTVEKCNNRWYSNRLKDISYATRVPFQQFSNYLQLPGFPRKWKLQICWLSGKMANESEEGGAGEKDAWFWVGEFRGGDCKCCERGCCPRKRQISCDQPPNPLQLTQLLQRNLQTAQVLTNYKYNCSAEQQSCAKFCIWCVVTEHKVSPRTRFFESCFLCKRRPMCRVLLLPSMKLCKKFGTLLEILHSAQCHKREMFAWNNFKCTPCWSSS